MRTRPWFVLLLAVFLGGGVVVADEKPVPADLQTVAESSGFTETSKSAEVASLVDKLCARGEHLRRFTFGRTVEGKDMLAVMAARPMVKHQTGLKDDPRLVVLLLGNIHSGECAAKEALLMLLRDIALDAQHPWLDDVVLIVAPNYNADGNDRFGPNEKHRRNQVGPKEMGTRANAMGLDLNRDFVKMESPEARALIGLMNDWNPHLFIDGHTTNGSWHRYVLTYDVPHNPAAPEAVRRLLRERLLPAVTKSLEALGMSSFYYGNFDKDHAKWTTYGYEPRYSTEYVGLRGRLAILSEAYSYATYEERIVATKAFVEACVDWVRAHPAEVKRATTPSAYPRDMPIRAKVAPFEETYLLLGYEQPPPATGDAKKGAAARVRPTVPKDYEVAFWGRYEAAKTVSKPYAYVLPVDLADVATRVMRHGICVDRLTEEATLEVEIDRVESIVQPKAKFQGHRLTTLTTKRRVETRTFPKGTFVVRAQHLMPLATFLLEPETADGLVTWSAFEGRLAVGKDYPVVRVPDGRHAERIKWRHVPAPRDD